MPSDASQQLSSPRTLGEILDALPSLENSDSTLTPNSAVSLITTSPSERPAPIGKPLSEHGLARLRSFAQSVQSGNLLDDQALGTLLVQHFGSRLTCKREVDHNYSTDGGYDPKVMGVDVDIDDLGDAELKLFDAIDFFNKPADTAFIARKLAQLRAVMARASESQGDIEIVIATYAEHVSSYPRDIVGYVIDKCIHTRKWFPLVSELCSEMESLVAFRRAVRTAFEEARNPLLAGKAEAKRVAADPRLGMSHRELEKKDWLPCHWRWYVEDAEHMAQLNRDNGRMTQADEWQVIAEQRHAGQEECQFAT
jgi:hypothetical protein